MTATVSINCTLYPSQCNMSQFSSKLQWTAVHATLKSLLEVLSITHTNLAAVGTNIFCSCKGGIQAHQNSADLLSTADLRHSSAHGERSHTNRWKDSCLHVLMRKGASGHARSTGMRHAAGCCCSLVLQNYACRCKSTIVMGM